MAADDLTLTVAGSAITGWTEVSVTRGCESIPSSFTVGMTDLYPSQFNGIVVQPGDACTVALGGDVVITGYVDAVTLVYTVTDHSIHVTGRGKCADLVDCSAELPGGQIKGLTALQIAQQLCKPYGITASGQSGMLIPQFNLMLGESGYDIIERICRFSSLLCYEGTDGNLILAFLEPTSAASGPVEGQNVLSASATYSIHDRFSDYDVFLQALDVYHDAGDGGNLVGVAKDPNLIRHRQKDLIAEGGPGGADLAQQRAVWEASRRFGRGYQLKVTIDSWRDSAGALWAPNTIIPVSLPNLKIPPMNNNWVLGEVTFARDESGTRAELTIMPDVAFLPQPILLVAIVPDTNIPTKPG